MSLWLPERGKEERRKAVFNLTKQSKETLVDVQFPFLLLGVLGSPLVVDPAMGLFQ